MPEKIMENTTSLVGNVNNTRLLFIEDSKIYVEAIKRAFVGDYYICSTYSADNGLDICRQFNPDVIILDINLAGNVTGLEFLRTLKRNLEFAHIPVLIISAITSFEVISEGLEFGANDYMVKPFELKHLQFKIKNLLNLRERIIIKSENEHLIPIKTNSDTKQLIIDKLNNFTDNAIARKTELNIPELVRILGISQSTLGRLVKKEFGVTTNNYMVLRKLEKAKLMMASNKYIPMKEVAMTLGFSSVSYFSKCFKDTFHQTPTEKHRLMHIK